MSRYLVNRWFFLMVYEFTVGDILCCVGTVLQTVVRLSFCWESTSTVLPAPLRSDILLIYGHIYTTRSIWKMLGPFATASRRTPHCHSPGVTACASMSTTTTTTTTTTITTTRDRGDRYGPIEWAQLQYNYISVHALADSIYEINIILGWPAYKHANNVVSSCLWVTPSLQVAIS